MLGLDKYDKKIERKFDKIVEEITDKELSQFQNSELGKSCCRIIMAYKKIGDVADFDQEFPSGIDPLLVISKLFDAFDEFDSY